MAPSQDKPLEKVIEEVLKSRDVQTLSVILQRDIHEGFIKCPHQFLSKLDTFVIRSLDQKDSKSASLGLAIIYKCGKNVKVPNGSQGLSEIIAQGLIAKWFEKCRQLWIQCGPQWDKTLFNLSEDFFEALMAVHEACKEGTCEITESFLYPVGQLAVDPRIYILIKKEAICTFNIILDRIPVELKQERKIRTSQEAVDIMTKLAGQILEGGDYDLQIALMEALFRMTSADQRKKLADRWFSMQHVSTAFVKIHDSEFETDCRKFLNLVNGIRGDRRRVYSYPCLEVHLDKHELLMPADEKLEEFWIDFNLGSHSISFYFSLADGEAQDGQWETICINENEVESYSVRGKGKRKVLQLILSEVVVVGAVEGSRLTIYFSSSLDILQAARSVYGHSKNKDFVGKTGTSIVKTTVKIIMEENSSQPTQVVPESQVSLGEKGKNTASYLLPTLSASVQTPAKMRISESTTFISNSGAGGSVHSAISLSAFMPSNTSAKGKGKPSLEMVQSSSFNMREQTTVKTCNHGTTPRSMNANGMIEQKAASKHTDKNKIDKQKRNIQTRGVDMIQAGQGEEQTLENGFVPDTQPRTERKIASDCNKMSVSQMLMMPTQKMNSLSRNDSQLSLAQQPQCLASAQRLPIPSSGQITQNQLNVKIIQCQQGILNETKPNPAPQEPAAAKRKMCEVNENSKGGQRTSKEQQAQRNGLAKGKHKGQMLEADAVAVKAPGTKTQHEKTPNVEAKSNRSLSKKEKKDAEVTGSMVKLISSHYDIKAQSMAKSTTENIPQCWIPPLVNRPIFNMSWKSTANREDFGAADLMKSNSKTTKSTRQRKDVFAFDIDAPLIIGGKDKTFTSTSPISCTDFHDSSVPLTTTKMGQHVAKEKRYVKKHLFSDTDTDYAMTEASWLRESSRKPKPQITNYSRPVHTKPKAVSPHISNESPDLPLPSPKPAKGNSKPNNKKSDVKKAAEQPKKIEKPAAPDRPCAAGRRPQRAAAATAKSYRDPDTDDSQSESENNVAPKLAKTDKTHETAQVRKRKPGNKQRAKSCMKQESNHHCSLSESESVSEKQPLISKKYFVGQQKKSENTCLQSPQVKKRKNTSEQSVDTKKKLDCYNQSDLKKPSCLKQQRPENVLQEATKFIESNVTPAQEQMNALEESRSAHQASLSPSLPFNENMRSAERSIPTLGLTFSPLLPLRGSPLPASPDLPCRDTPSPILLLPKPHLTVSSKSNIEPSSLYSVEKKRSTFNAQSSQSVSPLPPLTSRGQTPAVETCPVQRLFSASQSPLSLSAEPLLTSTQLELDKPPMPFPQSPVPEDTIYHGGHQGFEKVFPVSQISLSQSSVLSTTSLAVPHKTEKTPSSEREPEQFHISGPSRKRHVSLSSNSEEDEREERKKSKMRGQHSPRMRPRKLFKSSTRLHGQAQSRLGEEENKESRPNVRTPKVTKERISGEDPNIKNKSVKDTSAGTVAEVSAEGSQTVSSSHVMHSRHWEAEAADMDMDKDLELPEMSINPSNLCQQFSSELKKKFQNRSKMMEVYNKQSLKTVQQHVSSLSTQVTKYRTQRLEQVKQVLLEEIHKLEQNDTVLKNMEKDLNMYWRKQSMAFHSYQEQETRRNVSLKKALQSNMCHSLEYEERIFTSQMCLIRKDMKSVQGRLLAEMQEGEIKSVKRGLHTLFFP